MPERERHVLHGDMNHAVVYADSFMYANAIRPTTTRAAGGYERGPS